MAAWFLRLMFIAVGLIGSAFATKLLMLDSWTFSANVLLLPVALILVSLSQLYYGLHFTIRSILLGLGANGIFVLYGLWITALPSPDFANNNVLFDPLLRMPFSLFASHLLLFYFLPCVCAFILHALLRGKILTKLSCTLDGSFFGKSKYLSLFMIIYGVIILAANWYDPRFIKIFWFEVDAGTLIFPLTNILLDIVTEVYGYKHARLAIWCGFLFNIIILVLGQIVARWPSFDVQNVLAYQHFLLFNGRILLASIISYFATESISAYVLAQLKILFAGRLMALRFISSTMVGYLIDVAVFCLIAFTGLMSFSALTYIMVTSWLMMAGIEIVLLPITVLVSKKLKQRERLDIYDQHTDFTLFSLDSHYTKAQNKFHAAPLNMVHVTRKNS